MNSRACTVAMAPAPAVCARRYHGRGPWPLVHPLVAALDLAVDPGRGGEALEAWHPEDVERVWLLPATLDEHGDDVLREDESGA